MNNARCPKDSIRKVYEDISIPETITFDEILKLKEEAKHILEYIQTPMRCPKTITSNNDITYAIHMGELDNIIAKIIHTVKEG